MLKQRIITAVVLAALVILGVVMLPTAYLALAFALVAVIAGWEWTRLAGWRQRLPRVLYVLALGLALVGCWRLLGVPVFVQSVMAVALGWWMLAALWSWRYEADPSRFGGPIGARLAAGFPALAPTWLALVALHAYHGPEWVLFVLAFIAVADSGAYFSGRRWGKTKLAPTLSPGKTREGVIGALILAGVYVVAAGWYLDLRDGALAAFVALGLALVPVSVLGDLFESMLKRSGGFKDSGSVLPGHGGILDRIDSLTATAPVFLLGVSLARF